jgi:lysophospholipase L1-like esterase
MKILIAGDSFAADWTVKYPGQKGWPNLLAERFDVKNIAQAGVSEYRIYQQIMSVENLQEYDFCIISHTSPYRSVTRHHPVHALDSLHQHADLMLNDINYHLHTLKGRFNRSLRAAGEYIKYHYDIEFHETIYNLLKKEIDEKLLKNNTISIFDLLFKLTDHEQNLNLHELQKQYPGKINHFSTQGNQLIFQKLLEYIDNK